MGKQAKVIVSVTNDLETDQRVHKVCQTLEKQGYQVLLLGRRLSYSKVINRSYATKRFRLWFNRGPLFYLSYNLRLFFYLLFNSSDILISNDLDTLPANFFASKIRNTALVYDSHELFTEVPELINRPITQKIWKTMEAWMLPSIKTAYTVSRQIKAYYFDNYGIEMELIRNFPLYIPTDKPTSKENIILYQGALNIGRGLEELIQAMQYVENALLHIAGSGDIELKLKQLCRELDIEHKVVFLGRIPLEELREHTLKAKLGLSIEKSLGLNYQFALPNKVFDYIHAGVPVLYSDLIEVKKVLADFEVGEELKSIQPKELAGQIQEMLHSPKYQKWLNNCEAAATVLSWQNEEKKLIRLLDIVNNQKNS